MIVDEAPGLPAEFLPSIEGTLASGDSRLLMMGNPTLTSGPFFDAFGRSRSAWKTFSISAFDSPNFKGISLEKLLKLRDAELDRNTWPFLCTRRWVRERYDEWFNGGIENSPLWAARVLGEFPRDSTNALYPLALLEAARRAPIDRGDAITVGVDVAGPGRDRTVCVACAGGAIIDTGIYTDADHRRGFWLFCASIRSACGSRRSIPAASGFISSRSSTTRDSPLKGSMRHPQPKKKNASLTKKRSDTGTCASVFSAARSAA